MILDFIQRLDFMGWFICAVCICLGIVFICDAVAGFKENIIEKRGKKK